MYRLFFIIFISCLSSAKAQDSIQVVAKVGGDAITTKDLQYRTKLAAISAGLKEDDPEILRLKDQMLNTMIDEQLQLQVAKSSKIEATKEEVSKAIASLEQSNHMPPGSLVEFLKSHGVPLQTLERQVRAHISWMKFIRYAYAHQAKPTEKEVDIVMERWKTNKDVPHYHLAEIILNVGSPSEEQSIHQTALRISQDARGRVPFTALAQQFSQSPSSLRGGEIGWLPQGQIDSSLKSVVEKMNTGEVSDPIRTAQGYTIVALINKTPGDPSTQAQTQITFRQLLWPFPAGVTQGQAEDILLKADRLRKTVSSCDDMEKLTQKIKGSMTELSTDVNLQDLPPPMQDVFSKLNDGEISPPIPTEGGALLLMVCHRRTTKVDAPTREMIAEDLMEEKFKTLSRRALMEKKNNTLIHIVR